MKPTFKVALVAVLSGISGCSEVALTQPVSNAGQISPAPEPQPPETVTAPAEAPKATGKLSLVAASDIKALLDDPAASELARRDSANGVASRCMPPTGGAKVRKARGDTAPKGPKMEEIEAAPLKVGLIPAMIQPSLAAQLTEKTRVWKLESQGLDFYKILSDGRPEGLKPDLPAAACIRYSMFRQGGSELDADMIFSVAYSPKTPEIISLMPVRLYYRDFAALADGPDVAQAAVKVTLGLRSFSLERTSGRLATSVQNEETVVELVGNPGSGRPVYQLYDPVSGPTITIPLPPWDFSPASVNPRHNLSILGITVTEIADFGWLQSHVHALWPSWEYEATDVSKIKVAAQFYSHAHIADAVASP